MVRLLALLTCTLLQVGFGYSTKSANGQSPGQPRLVIPKVQYSSSGKRISANSVASSLQINAPSRRRIYRMDQGDVVGVFVKGIMGKFEDAPMQLPKNKSGNRYPGMGFPFTIQADGCLHLPMIPPVYVRNMTTTEVSKAIADAYLRSDSGDGGLILDERQVMVSLLQKRTVQVTVIFEPDNAAASSRPPSVTTVRLPVDRAKILNAIAAAKGPSPFAVGGIKHYSDRAPANTRRPSTGARK